MSALPESAVEWSLVNFIYKGYWFRHRSTWPKLRHNASLNASTTGLLILNALLLIPLMSSVINGIDSSLLNGELADPCSSMHSHLIPLWSLGLQILPEWKEYFRHPSGKTLGSI